MHNLDHSILHKIVRTAKKSTLDPLHVVEVTSAIFVGLLKTLVCNCSKGTALQHHSSENKNAPAHRTVNEYIILKNHVACMYSHIPFVSPNVQKADVLRTGCGNVCILGQFRESTG